MKPFLVDFLSTLGRFGRNKIKIIEDKTWLKKLAQILASFCAEPEMPCNFARSFPVPDEASGQISRMAPKFQFGRGFLRFEESFARVPETNSDIFESG